MINSDTPVNIFFKTDQYYWWEMNEEMLQMNKFSSVVFIVEEQGDEPLLEWNRFLLLILCSIHFCDKPKEISCLLNLKYWQNNCV